MTLRATLVLTIATASVLSLPPFALGAPGHEEMFIRRGVELRKKGRDKDALVEFRKAFEASHTPRAAAQLGLCEQAVEAWAQAHLHLSIALEAESDAWVSQNREVLENARTKVESHLAKITVGGSPGHAKVVVAGRFAGSLSDEIGVFVEPGEITVAVNADGYSPYKEKRVVVGGEAYRINAQLDLPRPLLVGTPDSIEQQGKPAASAEGVDLNAESSSHTGTKSQWKAWTSWAVAAAFFGSSAYFGIEASRRAESARTSEAYSKKDEDAARTSQRLQWVGIGAGTAAAVLGAVFYLQGPRHSEFSFSGTTTEASIGWRGAW